MMEPVPNIGFEPRIDWNNQTEDIIKMNHLKKTLVEVTDEDIILALGSKRSNDDDNGTQKFTETPIGAADKTSLVCRERLQQKVLEEGRQRMVGGDSDGKEAHHGSFCPEIFLTSKYGGRESRETVTIREESRETVTIREEGRATAENGRLTWNLPADIAESVVSTAGRASYAVATNGNNIADDDSLPTPPVTPKCNNAKIVSHETVKHSSSVTASTIRKSSEMAMASANETIKKATEGAKMKADRIGTSSQQILLRASDRIREFDTNKNFGGITGGFKWVSERLHRPSTSKKRSKRNKEAATAMALMPWIISSEHGDEDSSSFSSTTASATATTVEDDDNSSSCSSTSTHRRSEDRKTFIVNDGNNYTGTLDMNCEGYEEECIFFSEKVRDGLNSSNESTSSNLKGINIFEERVLLFTTSCFDRSIRDDSRSGNSSMPQATREREKHQQQAQIDVKTTEHGQQEEEKHKYGKNRKEQGTGNKLNKSRDDIVDNHCFRESRKEALLFEIRNSIIKTFGQRKNNKKEEGQYQQIQSNNDSNLQSNRLPRQSISKKKFILQEHERRESQGISNLHTLNDWSSLLLHDGYSMACTELAVLDLIS